jgi:sugar phosphate permease
VSGSSPRIFYGWYIVAVAFACNFMTAGTHFYVFNSFMEPLAQHRGWTREQINYGLSLGGMIGLMAQYVHGTLVMRFGPRIYMGVGAVFSGLTFAAIGLAQSINAFYLLYICLFIFNGAFCGIVANTAVNNWFIKKRGTALGISQVGISLSGVLLPVAGMMLYRWLGLEGAFMVLGGALFLLSPLCLAVIRDRPEKYGLVPDGPQLLAEDGSVIGLPMEEPLWSVRQAARTGAFWKVGLVYALAMMGVVGVMSQLVPRFTDVGFSRDAALWLMAATAFLGAAAKYLWGFFCDRFEPRKVVGFMLLMCAAGLVAGVFARGFFTAALFVGLYGFSMGGVLATLPVMTAHLFGRLSFTSISRFMALFLILQNLGFVAMGLSFSKTGSYDGAYAFFALAYLGASALVFSVKSPMR